MTLPAAFSACSLADRSWKYGLSNSSLRASFQLCSILTLMSRSYSKILKFVTMNRTALFPGSFDPFTAGHLNILARALTMFDNVVVAIGINQDKVGFFTNSQKKDIIRQATAGMDRVSVIEYDGLTVDVCRELGIHHVVRGVRNMLDFENERAIADANRRLAPDIETIIIPTAQEFAHISSSAVRDIIRHHGDTSLFLPGGVRLPERRGL